MIGIYKITNKINGHCYIGQSIDIQRRWACHKNSAIREKSSSHNYPLQKAIRKYGIDNFELEILCLCEKDDLLKKEQFYYKTHKPEYNQMYPCENPVFDPTIEAKRQAIFKTDSYRKKCSRNPSIETRKKLSESLRNSAKHKFTHNTPEYKAKMYKIRQNGKRKNKPVCMYNSMIKMNFNSMSDCANWISTNTKYTSKNKVSKIKAVCDGERKSAFGFKYYYI